MYGVNITVVKTEFYSDLAMDINTNIEGNFGQCPIFKVGQSFLIHDTGEIPENFCAWAWADIQRNIAMLIFGGQPQPVMKNPYSMYVCCDEGIRPVIFKLERVELYDIG
jgi:uncharacterized repeat protein (TIGR04076 family)